ncbi:MAG: hypothetical protein AAFY82_02925 [Pseudomonadota bacterium]
MRNKARIIAIGLAIISSFGLCASALVGAFLGHKAEPAHPAQDLDTLLQSSKCSSRK